MSSELVVRSLPLAMLSEEEVERIASLSVAELRQELAESLSFTAASLMRLAIIVRALEEKGEDVSELRVPLLTYLRRIAHGQLLPQVVARFTECPWLIRQISYLPLGDQQSLADGDPVRLVVRGADGFTHRMADPSKLSPSQRAQVFARDHVRSVEEQILWLESREVRKPRPGKTGRIRPDPERTGLVVGRTFIPAADVLAALATMRQMPEHDEPPESICAVKLSEAEHRQLRIRSAESGRSMQELVRSALYAAGLLGESP